MNGWGGKLFQIVLNQLVNKTVEELIIIPAITMICDNIGNIIVYLG